LCGVVLTMNLPLSVLAAGPPVAEPAGYWMGPAKGPVAATIKGGKVIHTRALAAMLTADAVMVVDVSDAPRRPAELAPGAIWLPVPHPLIPGGVWIPGAGLGAITPEIDKLFRDTLALGTHKDPTHEVVVYCHESCWLSWNAAKRAVSYGYKSVYWFPDGMEGWRAAGLPTAVGQPQTPN
jgi:PQQ-dependent catabolism-associated CXXCW motif protein